MKIVNLSGMGVCRWLVVATVGSVAVVNILFGLIGAASDLLETLAPILWKLLIPLAPGRYQGQPSWSQIVQTLPKDATVTAVTTALFIFQIAIVLWWLQRCLELRPIFIASTIVLFSIGYLLMSAPMVASWQTVEKELTTLYYWLLGYSIILFSPSICALAYLLWRKEPQIVRSVPFVTKWRLLPTYSKRTRALALLACHGIWFVTVATLKALLLMVSFLSIVWLSIAYAPFLSDEVANKHTHLIMLAVPMLFAIATLAREQLIGRPNSIGVFAVFLLFFNLLTGLWWHGPAAWDGSQREILADWNTDRHALVEIMILFCQTGPWGAAFVSPAIALRHWVIGQSLAPMRAMDNQLKATARELIDQCGRKPIVYLRAFQDDSTSIKHSLALQTWVTGEAGRMRLEQSIADALFPVAPFVALSSPRTTLAQGAVKERVEGSQWQQVVTDWIEKSELVVMLLGNTTNLKWELDQIIKAGQHHKLLVILPPGYPASTTIHDTLPELARLLGLSSAASERRLMHGIRVVGIIDGQPCGVRHLGVDTLAYQDCVRYMVGQVAGYGSPKASV